MQRVENGMFVSVEYTGTLGNGETFDSSRGRQPLEVEMGAGQLISGFEAALMGMSLNEKKVFTLEPKDAYGPRDENHCHDFAKSEIPPQMKPEVGQTVALTTPQGQQIPARITHVDDERVTVDLNHPLAGEALTFEIEVVGISKTPNQAPVGCGCGAEESGCGGGHGGSGCNCG
ncbi:MAG: FKBP-type peptidyl-prolyl cis-trans isomerase [Desulfobacterales bacterium]